MLSFLPLVDDPWQEVDVHWFMNLKVWRWFTLTLLYSNRTEAKDELAKQLELAARNTRAE